ncbi:hypothetical protein N7447_002549 [Penicillium robsamsonii]|uniref:uncharacterized protein n=1 Tax=Penicillium robsamsonii TaxID=1792511 RepID=UPI0025482D4D|nr:uncharacterized protein N7447_002549 [Penicillium robsamsonii]KAJ5836523.1 hypothetical protein N7447_002549 [Penicillium robsamsonii]
MFESLFNIFKPSSQEAAAQQHYVEGMTTQKFSSPPSPVAERVIDQQPSVPDQMQQLHLRGGVAPGFSASSAAPAASVVDGVANTNSASS